MKNIRYGLTGIILTGVLVGAVLLVRENNPASSSAPLAQDSKSIGPKTAPIQIIEYSDFQCPACARAKSALDQVMALPEFAGKIHFIYRHFPLSGHRWSGLAHQSAECAHEQGEFWKYHDALYASQAQWSALENPTESFLQIGKQLNLKMESFAFCLANPEIHHRVMAEKKKGEEAQIRSTPTFFINGERLVGPMEFEMRAPEIIRKKLGLNAPAAEVPAETVSSNHSPVPESVP